MKRIIFRKSFCRSCRSRKLQQVFSFGPTPLANSFLKKSQLDAAEQFFPLDVYFCQDCHFLQLGHVVSPETLFKNYVYVSSTSPVFVSHFQEYAAMVVKRLRLKKTSLVIDVGSNDGILLKPFQSLGIRVLGIEPARKIAIEANKEGIPTVDQFISPELARKIVLEHGKASVVTANNVFAHIDNLDEVIKAVKILLDEKGVLIIEAPYLVDFFKKNYFDLVYHEHLSYLSVTPLQVLFRRLGMKIFYVEKTDAHGGSVRIWVQKEQGSQVINSRVRSFVSTEKDMRLDKIQTYVDFNRRVLKNKASLITLLTKLKTEGKSIAGYGAPAKGNTLLNYFGIGTDYLDFIVDDSPLKQGLFSPGRHVPVVGSGVLHKSRPQYLLILAWNFAEPIMRKLAWYKESGGKFIVPVPVPKIL